MERVDKQRVLMEAEKQRRVEKYLQVFTMKEAGYVKSSRNLPRNIWIAWEVFLQMSRAAALALGMNTHHRAGTPLQRKLLPALPGEPLHLALDASTYLHLQLRCPGVLLRAGTALGSRVPTYPSPWIQGNLEVLLDSKEIKYTSPSGNLPFWRIWRVSE